MSEQQPNPIFQIQRVYLKEASMEQPNSPAILLETEAPSLDIQLNLSNASIADGVYEVTVTATVHTKVKDKTVFLVEVGQAGIFEIRDVPQDQLVLLLNIGCSQIIYPYLRGNMADIIQRGGFPPVHLPEINFQALYEQNQAQPEVQAPQVEAVEAVDVAQLGQAAAND